MRFIAMILVLCTCISCDSNSDIEEIDPSWIYDSDPMIQALEAIEDENYKFLGIYSYSIIVPGVHLSCVDLALDVLPIEGTSDASSSYRERKFNAVARIYAEEYNFQMRDHLERIGKFHCEEHRREPDS